ncbi:S1 RNA-binding domain-containing protein [Neisseriaceae bacterium PsAf]|nr:S1 RNA-binding domain-containing protein [Neisseriaceae bacterium PsAf]
MDIDLKIAQEMSVDVQQVKRAVQLLDEGATVPFIARYRKEATNGLDDTQLRYLLDRLAYFRELEDRKQTVLRSIEEQDQLTLELQKKIVNIDNKTELEDLYLPYRPKRRTKAQIAKEAGLEPLAEAILLSSIPDLNQKAQSYLNPEKQINQSEEALKGARYILMERFSEQTELIGKLREDLWKNGIVETKVVIDKEIEAEKFKDYFAYQENINRIPSHRALAILRGKKEGFLQVKLGYPEISHGNIFEERIIRFFNLNRITSQEQLDWLLETVRLAWKTKIFISLELELLNHLKEIADKEAINVFASNLRDLLLAAPAGRVVTMGLDPGIRTGVKVAVIDDTGKLLETSTIYPFQPRNDKSGSWQQLRIMIDRFGVKLIAIGNGTASRETDKLVTELLVDSDYQDIHKVIVSEAGASVYSASELAANEFPDLDVSLRGAVSIARRLQDPLAELVKIEPKAIGVGQYQHDVNQSALSRSLDDVVEDCVNAVGVDVNTASEALLSYVAGLNNTHAKNIINYRNQHGAFQQRADLLKVDRLGAKTYEQAIGFIRINGGLEPLDASAVHPEAYPIVFKMLKNLGVEADDLIGNDSMIKKIRAQDYITEQFGLPTIVDILKELQKPGRDPRGEFQVANYNDEVQEISDLKRGMILEGVITNVANFGAFVDIGVHQDGLVHISAMAKRFIKDPKEVVKVGQVIQVKVMEVDEKRKRIALSMILDKN